MLFCPVCGRNNHGDLRCPCGITEGDVERIVGCVELERFYAARLRERRIKRQFVAAMIRMVCETP